MAVLSAKEKAIGQRIISGIIERKKLKNIFAELGINYMYYQRKFRDNSWFKNELAQAEKDRDNGVQRLAASDMVPVDEVDSQDSIKMRMFLEAYVRNDFKVKDTLKKVKVSEQKYYGVWKKNAMFVKALETAREEMLDHYIGINYEIASDKKHGMAQSNSTIFAIKCLGKDKGWDERSSTPSLNINFTKESVDAIVRAANMITLDDVIEAETVDVGTSS